jgi:hypothetical protein
MRADIWSKTVSLRKEKIWKEEPDRATAFTKFMCCGSKGENGKISASVVCCLDEVIYTSNEKQTQTIGSWAPIYI